MTDAAVLERMDAAFRDFHACFSPLFGRREWQEHGGHYLRALLVQSQDRRNAENLSESVGMSARSMQRFLAEAPWDDDLVMGRLQEYLAARLEHPLAVLVVSRAVDVQGECPLYCSAEMSLICAGIVSDAAADRVAGDRRVGGLSASIYRLTVSRWRLSSLAILRMDMPWSLAFCTASHRACCRNVGLLGEAVTVIETTSSSSMPWPWSFVAAIIVNGPWALTRTQLDLRG